MKRIFLFCIVFLSCFLAFASLVTPTPNSPSNGLTNALSTITIKWSSVSGASTYEYRYATDSLFSDAVTARTSSTSKELTYLRFAQTYYWQVRALKTSSPADSSAWSPVWQFTTSNSPISLSSPSDGATSIIAQPELSWNTRSGISYYDYEVDTVPDFSSSYKISGTRGTGYGTVSVSNLAFGKTHYWRIRGRHSRDTLDWSATWNFTTSNSPISLSSPSDGATSIIAQPELSWNTRSGISYYDYEIDTVPDFSSSYKISGTRGIGYGTVSVSNLAFGKTHYWRIRGRHSRDTLDWSATWHFTTSNSPISLSSPSNGATGRTPQLSLSWNTRSGITYYDYEVDTVPDFSSSYKISGTRGTGNSTVSVSNLVFGKTHYWRIRGRHSRDTLDWSATWNFTTSNLPISLSSPSNGATSIIAQPELSWITRSGITYYDYEVDTVPDFSSSYKISGTRGTGNSTVSVSNLAFGKTHYWRIRGRHSRDTLDWSAAWNFTTSNSPISLSSPTNGATGRTPQQTLSWTTRTGITYYDYEVDTVPDFSSSYKISGTRGTGNSTVSVSNLVFGKTHYWRIRGRHSRDTLDWSAAWNFTTSNSPISLSSPTNGATGRAPQQTLSWTTRTGITNYDYEVDTVPDFSSNYKISGTRGTGNSTVSVSNLAFGKTHYWRIRGRHSCDTLDWSAAWNFTTVDKVTLNTPVDNSVVSPPTSVSWFTISGISGYLVEVDVTPEFNSPYKTVVTRGSSNTTASITNLLFGQTYYWHVCAYHSSDTTNWSMTRQFRITYQMTTAPTLILPANDAVNIPNSGTTLTWNGISGATNYEIQLANNINFSNATTFANAGTAQATGILQQNSDYYWKVRAQDTFGYSPWSETRHFSTETTIVDPIDPIDTTIIDPIDPIDTTIIDPIDPIDPIDTTIIDPIDPIDTTIIDPIDPIDPIDTTIIDPIDPITAIRDMGDLLDVAVFPNPCNNLLNIQYNICIRRVAIIDVLGQVIYSQLIDNQGVTSINVGHYPNGIYFIKLETADATRTVPIIIKH